jgi:uncharacterized protein YkwD
MKNASFLLSSMLFCAFFVFFIFPQTLSSQTPREKTENLSTKLLSIPSLEHQVFGLINEKRIQNGLKPLIWNEQVAQVARLHSRNMALYNFFSHVGIDGKRVDDRADSFRLSNWRMIGENLAFNRGFSDPVGRAIDGWMQSPQHRENLLRKKWREAGVGVSITPTGAYYFTMVFIILNK